MAKKSLLNEELLSYCASVSDPERHHFAGAEQEPYGDAARLQSYVIYIFINFNHQNQP
jgi:hypothetical protein